MAMIGSIELQMAAAAAATTAKIGLHPPPPPTPPILPVGVKQKEGAAVEVGVGSRQKNRAPGIRI